MTSPVGSYTLCALRQRHGCASPCVNLRFFLSSNPCCPIYSLHGFYRIRSAVSITGCTSARQRAPAALRWSIGTGRNHPLDSRCAVDRIFTTTAESSSPSTGCLHRGVKQHDSPRASSRVPRARADDVLTVKFPPHSQLRLSCGVECAAPGLSSLGGRGACTGSSADSTLRPSVRARM